MSESEKNALSEIERTYLSMSETERKLADFIRANAAPVVNMTVHQIAEQTGVSDGSVIRFANQLGFPGFTALKISIAKNLKNRDEVVYGSLTKSDTPKIALDKTFENAVGALRRTAEMITAQELQQAAEMLQSAKRIEFYGVGSSSMVAQDAYYRFMRIGLPAYVITDPHICVISASLLTKDCLAVGISHSGRTIETLRAMELAKERGAKTLCLTSYLRSPMAQLCDLSLVVASNETEHHREAVASRLVQLAVLDALCGYIMVQSERSLDLVENLVDLIGEHRK